MRPRLIRLSTLAALGGLTFALAATLSADNGPAHQVFQTRPIQLGTSGGNIKDRSKTFCCSGTLGALVARDGVQFVLSNNHVLARTNKGSVGDDIIQPGLIDQTPACFQDANDAVADLSTWVPITFNGAANVVDAAIAQVRAGKVDTSGAILDIGQVSTAVAPATLGIGVKKSGRTTGLTTGTVAAVNVTIIVRYGSPCGGGRGKATFVTQIRITPSSFSAGGDSGSLIVEDVAVSPRPVGLLFAGSSTDTFANPIQSALDAFGVSVVGNTTSGGLGFWRWLARFIPGNRPAHAAQPPRRPPVDPASQAAATRAKEGHERAILAIQGVVGLGVGISDVAPGEAVVEVYVERDTPAVRGAIPPFLDNVPVKIVETGEITARSDSCASEP
jgi:hypothetical protein